MTKRPRIEMLEASDIEDIVDAAYDLLNNFGVFIENRTVLKLLGDNGARVDLNEKVAYLPADLIDKTRKTVPRGFSVYDQAGDKEALLAKDEVHFAPGSVPVNILDSDTEMIRKPNIQDLINITRLVDSLEYVDFQTGPLVPNDIPGPIQDAFRFFLILLNTNKPIFGGAFTTEGLRCQIELLNVTRGGADNLRATPRVIFAANPTAPLMWGGIIMDNLVDSARAGIPVMLIPMPLPGGNSPVTLAGTLTEHTAENLSGLVIAQLVNPGTPVLWGGGAIVLDMRYGMSCIGAIESHMLGLGYNQIGKALGLPTASNIGQSDSQRLDAQAGIESGIGITMAALGGINLSRGPGMLNFANCQSLEKLVVDNNICGAALRLVRGIECSPETIALDVIKNAGRGAQGHLSSDHTMKWFKQELFLPSDVINRRAAMSGKRTDTAHERAKEEVKQRLANHKPDPLPQEAVKEMTRIMTSYAKTRGVDILPEF